MQYYTFVFKNEYGEEDYTEVMAYSEKEAKEEVNRLIEAGMVHPDTLDACIEIQVDD